MASISAATSRRTAASSDCCSGSGSSRYTPTVRRVGSCPGAITGTSSIRSTNEGEHVHSCPVIVSNCAWQACASSSDALPSTSRPRKQDTAERFTTLVAGGGPGLRPDQSAPGRSSGADSSSSRIRRCTVSSTKSSSVSSTPSSASRERIWSAATLTPRTSFAHTVRPAASESASTGSLRRGHPSSPAVQSLGRNDPRSPRNESRPLRCRCRGCR